MRINNYDESYFNMRANSFSYQPLIVAREVFQPDNSIYPILSKPKIRPKKMKIVAEFRGKKDISNFIAELLRHNVNIIDIDDGFLYKTYVHEIDQCVTERWQGWYRLSLPVLVIQCGYEQRYKLLKENNTIINNGNYMCDCIYEIIPLKNVDSITIDKITIKNLVEGNKVILNGEAKKVFSNTEVNKYNDCIFGDNQFPKVDPGVNTIHISNYSDVEINLIFTPIYI